MANIKQPFKILSVIFIGLILSSSVYAISIRMGRDVYWNSDLIPATGDSVDLGSSEKPIANMYATNVQAETYVINSGVTNLGITVRYGFIGTPSATDDMWLLFNRGAASDIQLYWDEGEDKFKAIIAGTTALELDTSGNAILPQLDVSKFVKTDVSKNLVSHTLISSDITDLTTADTGISSIGILTSGTWQAATITDLYISKTLTIDSTGSIDKGALKNTGILGFDWSDNEVADDLTVSGGTINNTAIGAVTASTGAFTSLTVSATSAFQGRVQIGTTNSSSKLTITETGDFAIGDFNAKIIDDMEVVSDWSSYDTNYVNTTLETSIVKVGTNSLKIDAAGTSEDVCVAKTFSAEDWSAYERLGLWIYSDRVATSTATTTQLISIGISSDTSDDTASSTHQISIQEENRWQYEEWNIHNIQHSTSVDRLFFRIDFGELSTFNFYIDHIRLYDDDERTGEMFVDIDGTLVIMSRDAVEIGRASGSSNKPGIKVDTAIVEINQPLAVAVAGDTGFSQDLQFLNTGITYITSEGPLRIEAGDSNHAENLTLTTGNKGDVIVELNNASSSMIITQASYTTTTAFMINSEGNATTTKTFEIITDVNSDENVVLDVDNSGKMTLSKIQLDKTATSTCATAIAGEIMFSYDNLMYYCDGTNWVKLSP